MVNKFKIWWSYHFPYYDWWKVRNKIIRPHIHYNGFKTYSTGWFFGLPVCTSYLNPIISIQTSNVGWKTKYNMVRWEWNPFIAIILFRKWIFSWTICWSKDYCKNLRIWETILEHIYYNTPLKLDSTDQYLDDSNVLIYKNQ